MNWIGYEIRLKDSTLGISKGRADWLVQWIEERLREMSFDLSDLVAVLGRLASAMGPLPHIRRFMAPLYSWSAAVGRRGRMRLPWSLAFVLKLVRGALGGRRKVNGYLEIAEGARRGLPCRRQGPRTDGHRRGAGSASEASALQRRGGTPSP